MATQPVDRSIAALAARVGVPGLVATCVALLDGADRGDHLDALTDLTRLSQEDLLLRDRWHDYWLPTWAARGLLHQWPDVGSWPAEVADASAAVRRGLRLHHWRPVEMCLKVVAHHDIDGCADEAARLARHSRARVRSAAARALGVVGDTEHVDAVRRLLADPDAGCRRASARAAEAMAERLDLPPHP